MKTTVDLDQLYRYAKDLAHRSGRSLGEIISTLALAGMTSISSQPNLHSNPLTLDQDPSAKVNIDALMSALQELP